MWGVGNETGGVGADIGGVGDEIRKIYEYVLQNAIVGLRHASTL